MKQTRQKRQPKQAKRKTRQPALHTGPGLHKAAEPKDIVLNTRVRDSSSKIIFDDHTLCSQFLRDYVDLPCLKGVRPEDIEDVSEQYVTLFAEERNSDRVKRVHISGGGTPFFLVSLIEHKTSPDYNVCMQVFRYMVYIWDAYAKEVGKAKAGAEKGADFLYPPILPIVYYEGAKEWSVPRNFRSRVREGETFGKYIPDFEYYLVPLRGYSNEELVEKGDEISLVMLINKLQTAEDVEAFLHLPEEEVGAMIRDAPGYLADTIADVLRTLLLKMNVPVPETEALAGKVKEKKMGELFADMEKMDIQAERRETAKARRWAEEAERRADKAEQRAEEQQKRAEEQQKRAEEAETRLRDAEEMIRKLTENSAE